MTEPRTVRIVRGDIEHRLEAVVDSVDSRCPFELPLRFPLHGHLYFDLRTWATKAKRFHGWHVHPGDRAFATETLREALREVKRKQAAKLKAKRK